jgi:lipopolysaccharide export LptBFGC system permease protein LptF
MLAFLGEQLSRMGLINVTLGGLIPIVGSLLAIVGLAFSRRVDFSGNLTAKAGSIFKAVRSAPDRLQPFNLFVDLTTGLRDFDILRNLLKNFLLTLCFLSAIFLIFTAFELWKFAGAIDGGVFLLVKYLFFLLPFIYLQIAPSAAMIGTLATYVIKSRQNEIVTWTSAGQSVYRLLLPCFLLMALIGGVNWLVQERVLPPANRLQDETRLLIRNQGTPVNQSGKYWTATDGRIYSFELVKSDASANRAMPTQLSTEGNASDNDVARRWSQDSEAAESQQSPSLLTATPSPLMFASDNEMDGRSSQDTKAAEAMGSRLFLTAIPTVLMFASDNEKPHPPCSAVCVRDLGIYEFANNGLTLQTVYRAEYGGWDRDRVLLFGRVEKSDLTNGTISTSVLDRAEIPEKLNPLAEPRRRPNHLDSSELKETIAAAGSELEQRNLQVSLERKYTTPFLPFVMASFTAPFSLSLSRKGKAATVGYAVGLWLLYTGTSTVFEQFGLNGMLTPAMAIWSPLVLFSLIGIYLISKVRT